MPETKYFMCNNPAHYPVVVQLRKKAGSDPRCPYCDAPMIQERYTVNMKEGLFDAEKSLPIPSAFREKRYAVVSPKTGQTLHESDWITGALLWKDRHFPAGQIKRVKA